jgi:hypothetical protein
MHLPLEVRLEDIDKLAELIRREAYINVRNPQVLREVDHALDCYVARNFIGHMGGERTSGVRRMDIARVAWVWRRRSLAADVRDLPALLRPIALFVLPAKLVPHLRGVQRSLLRPFPNRTTSSPLDRTTEHE